MSQGETLVQNTLNSLSAHIAVLDAAGVIIAVNEAWRRFARQNGCEEKRVGVGVNYFAVCQPATAAAAEHDAAEALRGIRAVMSGAESSFAFEYPCHSGTEQRWFQMTVRPLGASQAGVVVAHEDITQFKRAADLERQVAARRKSEAAVVAAMAASPNLADGAIAKLAVELTEAAAAAIQVDRVGVWFFEGGGSRLVSIDTYDATDQTHTAGLVRPAHEFGREFTDLPPAKPGEAHEALTDSRPAGQLEGDHQPNRSTSMLDAVIRSGGKPIGVLCFECGTKRHQWENDEITFARQLADQLALALLNQEHKQAENALRQSEEQFRRLFEGHSAIKLIIDPFTGSIIDANKAAAAFYGWSIAELRQMRMQQINTLSPDAITRELEKARLAQKEKFDFRHRTADGSVRDVEVYSNRIETGGRVMLYSIVHDVTERRRLERAVVANASRLRAIVETEPECVKIVSPAGALLEMNPAGLRMLEAETLAEAQSRPLITFVAPEYRAGFGELHRRVMEGHSATLAFEVVGLKGGRRWLETHAVPLRDPDHDCTNLLGVTRDITERRRSEEAKEKLEAQNRHLQKSESLGRMAGAIAHLFNNRLQGVMGNLELILIEHGANARLAESLAEAMESARMAAEVSSLMLTYIGQAPAESRILDLAEVCRRSLSMITATLPKNAVLDTAFPVPGPVIKANGNQIQQVLFNLVTNAWEALVEKSGTIHLAVRLTAVAEIPGANRFPPDWRPKDDTAYACLEVADTGRGIPEQDLEKLFEPFFTTKFAGRGLGLAVVWGIIRSLNGVITVRGNSPRGSVFSVFLPALANAIPQPPLEVPSTPRKAGDGTILIADDEVSLRTTYALALKHYGFKVLVAADGVEAMEEFRRHQEEVTCVLCDLTMPRMNGWETLAAVRKLKPGIPVILVSGYDEAHVMAGDHPERPQAVLHKPFEFDTLITVISQVLAEKK